MNTARILALGVAAAIAAPARAQGDGAAEQTTVPERNPGCWRVSVSTGFLGFVEVWDTWAAAMEGASQQDRYQVGVRVDREVGRASFGVGYTLQHWRDVGGGAPGYPVDNTVQVVLADARYRWLRTTWVDLYSGGGLGFASWTETGTSSGAAQDDTLSSGAFQFRMLGVDAGWEHVRLWAELGLGFEGLLVAGASWRF